MPPVIQSEASDLQNFFSPFLVLFFAILPVSKTPYQTLRGDETMAIDQKMKTNSPKFVFLFAGNSTADLKHC